VTHTGSVPWFFDYAPLPSGGYFDGTDHDLVIATTEDVDPARLVELAGRYVPDLWVTPLFNSHPVFWTRLESTKLIDVEGLSRVLEAGGVTLRYITSARRGSQVLPPQLCFDEARVRGAHDWCTRGPSRETEEDTPWRWFLRQNGADVDRSLCGTGAGTRLAVIDNDGRELDKVNLDAEVLVGVDACPRGQAHAAMLVGWAVGARREDGTAFRGVAPDASPRVYCIPKPCDDVWSLPLAILRAVDDGADVVVCATYVEGLTSPLLDDALEFAVRLGRGGRGTAVVLPTGREMSSPEGSLHSSLSLGMADPAADPRVFCAAPSSRDGGWFLWRDRRGKIRPFANRGPTIRWLAPGDDMAYPFATNDRPAHAESSGASAVAGGVILLLLGQNPDLSWREVDTLLRVACVPVDPARQADDPELADRRDLLPLEIDADGHNAKHGYGRLSARRACLAAADPMAQVMVRLDDVDAAQRYLEARRNELQVPMSDGLARWAARVALRDFGLSHSLASGLRALRLAVNRDPAAPSEPPGHWLRHVGIWLRMLVSLEPTPEHARELRSIESALRGLSGDAVLALEERLLTSLGPSWTFETNTPSRIVELRDPRNRAPTLSSAGFPRTHS
jgi:hypothetical protein